MLFILFFINHIHINILFFDRTPLPKFDATLNGVNELDLQMQDIRRDEMSALSEEASLLREQATDINEAMEVINSYLDKMQTLCLEVSLHSLK